MSLEEEVRTKWDPSSGAGRGLKGIRITKVSLKERFSFLGPQKGMGNKNRGKGEKPSKTWMAEFPRENETRKNCRAAAAPERRLA